MVNAETILNRVGPLGNQILPVPSPASIGFQPSCVLRLLISVCRDLVLESSAKVFQPAGAKKRQQLLVSEGTVADRSRDGLVPELGRHQARPERRRALDAC